MTQIEQWRPVPGWAGIYSVSDQGRVRSENRTVTLPCGQIRSYRQRILSPAIDPMGRCQINLKNGAVLRKVRIHTLVLEAFVGPRPEGMEACHFDDDATNNKLENLRWDTSLANKQDMARNGGGNQNKEKTHCVRGHEFTPDNVYHRGDGGRDCRKCWKMRPSSYRPSGTGNKDKTHCVNGHEFTPENIYWRRGGGRQCRKCALGRAKTRQQNRSHLLK